VATAAAVADSLLPETGDSVVVAGGTAATGDALALAACRALNTQHDSVPHGIPVSALTARYPISIDLAVALAFSSAV
jgi:hypothetical protein